MKGQGKGDACARGSRLLPFKGGKRMSPKILVVDDDRNLLRLFEYVLQKAGFTVITAMDGERGLELALAERPDLVMLDLKMPKLDGMEVLRKLKADPSTAAIPVVVITASAQKADAERALQEGAVGYLVKPFRIAELIYCVRTALS
ncbi:MAG TPA: response regulator [Anaerolineae bacterium]|nr:response regulator [Anaerolineae bacterium]